MKEVWKPIPNYSGYEASSLGRVRSLDRKVWVEQRHRSFWKQLKGKQLSESFDKDGYRLVSISTDGYDRPHRVSRLVCAAFYGPCPDGMECLHGAKGKYIDTSNNVSWGTKSQNEIDKRRDGVSNCRSVKRSDGILFDSISEAAQSVNGNNGYLSVKLRGGYSSKMAYGYEWEFI